jgi:hypothetical protein
LPDAFVTADARWRQAPAGDHPREEVDAGYAAANLPCHPGERYAVQMIKRFVEEAEIGEQCAPGGTVRLFKYCISLDGYLGREMKERRWDP